MEFVKGYAVESKFIPEGSYVTVICSTGEVLEGILLKPSKKEFRLDLDGMTRVLKVDDVEELKTN